MFRESHAYGPPAALVRGLGDAESRAPDYAPSVFVSELEDAGSAHGVEPGRGRVRSRCEPRLPGRACASRAADRAARSADPDRRGGARAVARAERRSGRLTSAYCSSPWRRASKSDTGPAAAAKTAAAAAARRATAWLSTT